MRGSRTGITPASSAPRGIVSPPGPPPGTMRPMAAIPESTRSSVALRLLDHAEQHWPQLHRIQVTSRAGFAYVTGILPDGEQIPLCRLRYGGSAHSFGFAIYSAARARYEDAVHLAGLGHEPPTN